MHESNDLCAVTGFASLSEDIALILLQHMPIDFREDSLGDLAGPIREHIPLDAR
jgi:hypothetical protein